MGRPKGLGEAAEEALRPGDLTVYPKGDWPLLLLRNGLEDAGEWGRDRGRLTIWGRERPEGDLLGPGEVVTAAGPAPAPAEDWSSSPEICSPLAKTIGGVAAALAETGTGCWNSGTWSSGMEETEGFDLWRVEGEVGFCKRDCSAPFDETEE